MAQKNGVRAEKGKQHHRKVLRKDDEVRIERKEAVKEATGRTGGFSGCGRRVERALEGAVQGSGQVMSGTDAKFNRSVKARSTEGPTRLSPLHS